MRYKMAHIYATWKNLHLLQREQEALFLSDWWRYEAHIIGL